MSSTQKIEDSWIELSGGVTPPVEAQSIYNGNLEKLLIEAQRESRSSSRPNSKESSARGSPKGLHSPTNELSNGESTQENRDLGTDWIWDWSSRPEALPPSDLGARFKHPRKSGFRSSQMIRKEDAYSLKYIIISNACSFVVGIGLASLGFYFVIKRYCRCSNLMISN
ncbi:BCL2/adenovirus E1B 19 kDa protein-interacting protein 3-like [Mytilus californianus]|uniref:BCL2/adenovirus E1B 19 kDa protein-interacting protein 3-like n=1 Tax=Mytilus californianus TaxID=6549 RepID=UPI002246BADF|nr:BCL2/adenovirus E1B 19 kDa protein-interacting protein 3-like [Mytilus californianus]